MKKNKTVYLGLSADGVHHGHMKLLEKAREYGDIIVGLLTDKAISTYKRLPYLNYEQRKAILSNFKGVKKIVPQEIQDYSKNIKKHKPDYMIHGDDWKSGYMKEFRKNCLKELKIYGGKLMGAGNGGFFLIIAPRNIQKKIIKKYKKLKFVKVKIEEYGSKIIYD